MNTIAFQVTQAADPGVNEVVPLIDGISLVERIHAFELERGFGPPNAYGGLIPAYFKFGTARHHFLEARVIEEEPTAPILGCECGEWGCWPLLARIVVTEASVQWCDFKQPHRKERDYGGFGPFTFVRKEYEAAVVELGSRWE